MTGAPRDPSSPIRVLVVDDSAVARQLLAALLASDPAFEVTLAADPLVAMERMKVKRPDVILLDLEMPRMDGLTFLRHLNAVDPIPVVVCSAATGRGTAAALQALTSGAVEVIEKPRLPRDGDGADQAEEVCQAVRAAACARIVGRRTPPPAPRPATPRPSPRIVASPGIEPVVAIGASTGGTEALTSILRELPADFPPLLVVQHMAAPFTGPFARALDRSSPMEVREARSGDAVTRGCCLVAPGSHHMRLVRRGSASGSLFVELWDGPRVSHHRPSVNVLFESVAKVAGANAVGVILTGMGDDGADGLLTMRASGAVTLGQDEASSVVYGMPGQARKRGAVVHEMPLDRVARTLVAIVAEREGSISPGGSSRG